ncbi:hypothetical protein [Kitasatospora sp. LaBMicrA B282]|uniref:hypothetical protein n=1 Tax=Kitasatospora sp. LaBMicrA B282 TaxID=3420949 RepID=UPI003D10E5FE
MPVKYIDVTATSELFAPAVRAFGDIAIVGKGRFGVPLTAPQDFTSPTAAVNALNGGGQTTLSADAAGAATTVAVPVSVPVGTVVQLGTGPTAEVRTVTAVAATSAPVATPAGGPAPPGGPAPGGPAPAAPPPPTTFTLTLDTPLATAHPAATPVTQVGDCDLVQAIRTAFRQSPPPTRIWGVLVDPTNLDWETALTAVDTLDVQIVVLANTPLNQANVPTLGRLAAHVSADLGDGKERIGVAMLDPSLSVDNAVALNAAPVKNERMVLIAHKSPDDVAAATAGVIAGYQPHISMLLKPIDIAMPQLFADTDIDKLDSHLINWVTSPVLLPGQALYLGEGYTSDASHDKKYIDIVRALDDINFRIKAVLIEAIGNLRISRVGLRSIVTLVQSVLFPLVSQQVIEDFTVVIPLLTLFDKDPATLSAAETTEIATARATRSVDMTVEVVYAGAIHRLKIDLVLTG